MCCLLLELGIYVPMVKLVTRVRSEFQKWMLCLVL